MSASRHAWPRRTRSSLLAGAIGGAGLVVMAALAVLDQVGTLEVPQASGQTTENVDADLALGCAAHPILPDRWFVEGVRADDRRPWRDPLPRSGALHALDYDWTVVELDRHPRPCASPDMGWDDDEVEDDDVEAEGIDAPWAKTGAARRRRYGVDGDIDVAAMLRVEPDRHHRTLAPGGIEPRPGGDTCLVEAGSGLHFCVDVETRVLGRVLAPGGPLLELLDLAPRVLRALDRGDGHTLWRTTVPTDAEAVWLLASGSGAVGLRANEAYFEVDLATGALRRVTPEGAEICNEGALLVSLADGVLSASVDHPATLRELARPGASALVDCGGPRSLPGTPASDLRVWVVVRAGESAGSEVAEPDRVVDAMAPLARGIGLYVIDGDGRLRAAWALPWARDFSTVMRLSATAADGTEVGLGEPSRDELRLDRPSVPLATP